MLLEAKLASNHHIDWVPRDSRSPLLATVGANAMGHANLPRAESESKPRPMPIDVRGHVGLED